MWNRSVESLESERARPSHRIGEIIGLHFECEVAPVETESGKGGLDHGLGRIFGDRVAEAGREFLLEVSLA